MHKILNNINFDQFRHDEKFSIVINCNVTKFIKKHTFPRVNLIYTLLMNIKILHFPFFSTSHQKRRIIRWKSANFTLPIYLVNERIDKSQQKQELGRTIERKLNGFTCESSSHNSILFSLSSSTSIFFKIGGKMKEKIQIADTLIQQKWISEKNKERKRRIGRAHVWTPVRRVLFRSYVFSLCLTFIIR